MDVAAGYARNYLFPKKQATKATKSAMKSADIYRKRAEEEERKLESAASVLAEKISGVSISFNETADENGHLYGSVSERDIATALSEKGFDIDRRQVRLPDGHLKHVGEHEVEINLHGEISGNVKVLVETDSPQKVPEEEKESAEEPTTDTEPAGEEEE